ncbi:MAG TPA: CYTH domain-containing protein [Chloroflexota bacterium]
MSTVERELKLTPVDPELLDRLGGLARLGPFSVTGRHRELQVNSFYDTKSSGLRRTRLGFRRRVIDRRPNAIWTVKAEGDVVRGISSRAEVEVQLSRLMAPALVIGVLRQAARERGAPALAEQISDALSDGLLPLPKPFLELETDRWVLALEVAERSWQSELALDRVGLVGHARYEDREIEVELKRGDEAALDAARAAIEALGEVRESHGSKLSRALDYIERSAPSSR